MSLHSHLTLRMFHLLCTLTQVIFTTYLAELFLGRVVSLKTDDPSWSFKSSLEFTSAFLAPKSLISAPCTLEIISASRSPNSRSSLCVIIYFPAPSKHLTIDTEPDLQILPLTSVNDKTSQRSFRAKGDFPNQPRCFRSTFWTSCFLRYLQDRHNSERFASPHTWGRWMERESRPWCLN